MADGTAKRPPNKCMEKWLCIFLVVSLFTGEAFAKKDKKQKEDIYAHAENHATGMHAPPFHPTRVKFSATLIKVEEIEAASEDNPALTAKFSLEVSWPDARLAQSGADGKAVHSYQDQDAEKILQDIFNPNISVVDGEMHVEHQHLKIFPDGRVRHEQVVTVKVPANLNLLRFPFDSQAFLIRFASAFWDDTEVDIIQEITSSENIEDASNNAWNLSYRSFYVSKATLRKNEEKYSVFNFYIYAERDPGYFIWRLMIPLMVIVFLSWNVFWLHKDKAMALGNCFLFLLTVVTFHDTARSMLPVLSYFTFLDAMVFISYAFIIIPTIQVVLSIRLEDSGDVKLLDNIRRMCKWLVPTLYFVTVSSAALHYFLM